MTKVNKILVGVALDGRGGTDNYILSFVKTAAKHNISCDVLTTKLSANSEKILKEHNASLISVPSLKNLKQIEPCILDLCKNNIYKAVYWNISTAIMYPYIKAASKCNINNFVVHSHAQANDQPTKIKTFIFDNAHKYFKYKIAKLRPNYASCSSNCAKWMLTKKDFENNNWTFIPNPIDTEKFTFDKNIRNSIRSKLNLDNKLVIGSVSSFMPVKNPKFLVEIFKEMCIKQPNSYLLLAGDGPLQKETNRLADAILPQDSYKFLGHTNDIQYLLQAFDCFLLPSISEGMPLSFLEAQASGLPCVISNSISKEAQVIPGLVKQISLNHDAKYWSKFILDHINNAPLRSSEFARQISEAGFNNDSPKLALKLLGF